MKNRSRQSGWWILLVTMALIAPAASEAGVNLFNSRLKQITTSSTLKWKNFRKEFMNNYVVGAESEEGTI